MISRRVHLLKAGPLQGAVLYWMSRDQRVQDNAALSYAQQLACDRSVPLGVCFTLSPSFLNAPSGAYAFMLDGLEETAASLAGLQIPFHLLIGEPVESLPRFAKQHGFGTLVTDFDPLREKQRWQKAVSSAFAGAVHEVDAHNIVPCRIVSEKAEYGAYTFRPKIMRMLDAFMAPVPAMIKHPFNRAKSMRPVDWRRARASVHASRGTYPFPAGPRSAKAALKNFMKRGVKSYDREGGDPACDGQSGLSPYLHFGQISAAGIVRALIADSRIPGSAKDAFLEQLIVRRELSDNFCFYQPRYDSLACLPAWAAATLKKHATDPRPYRYTRQALENADTHDAYWNAAQKQMMASGKMHGYMRMYWGKKIVEWTADPAEAIETAVQLNNAYELDGRDPNGYAGIAWCFGMHDRPWAERPVFGMVRTMTASGLERKFDMAAYLARTPRA